MNTSIGLTNEDENKIVEFTKILQENARKSQEIQNNIKKMKRLDNASLISAGRKDMINDDTMYMELSSNENNNLLFKFKDDIFNFIDRYLMCHYLPNFLDVLDNDFYMQSDELIKLSDDLSDLLAVHKNHEIYNLSDYISEKNLENPKHVLVDIQKWWDDFSPEMDIKEKTSQINKTKDQIFNKYKTQYLKEFVEDFLPIAQLKDNIIVFPTSKDNDFIDPNIIDKIISLIFHLRDGFYKELPGNKNSLPELQEMEDCIYIENTISPIKEIKWQLPIEPGVEINCNNEFIMDTPKDAKELSNYLKKLVI